VKGETFSAFANTVEKFEWS